MAKICWSILEDDLYTEEDDYTKHLSIPGDYGTLCGYAINDMTNGNYKIGNGKVTCPHCITFIKEVISAKLKRGIDF